jgi:hypothetical protein
MNQRTVPPYRDFVSDEPLHVIESNECNWDGNLTTRRMRRVFNELHALQSQRAALAAALEGTMVERGGGWIKIHRLSTEASDLIYELLSQGNSEVINHDEALQLAYLKRGESNLARCYIALRELGYGNWEIKRK